MNSIIGVEITPVTKSDVLKVLEERLNSKTFTQIVSLNPEILVMAFYNDEFKSILNHSDIKIVDGVGVIFAGKLLSINTGERIPGADLMKDIISIGNEKKKKILLIGGFENVSDQLAETFSHQYTKATFMGHEGYRDITSPTETEIENIKELLKEFKPDIVFVAFGAPYQEEWIHNHKEYLKEAICMSVGGGIDFLTNRVPRAPAFMRKIGLEWLFRLFIQPWRIKRQLKLLTFIKLVLQQKFKHI